jgi:prepilin-type N-terminal cleavage/methylation domain-containing protein
MRVHFQCQEERRRRSGFTLIEMVISGAVAALILSAAYLCLSAAIAGQKLTEPRGEAIQNVRVAMSMITADLRAACPLSKDFDFLGMARTIGELHADNLDFATHHYTPRREHEGDYCEMSYFVEKEKGTGNLSLYRRRNPVIAIDPLSGGSRELIAPGLRGVRFEYFDGYDWYDSWGETDQKKKDRSSVQLAANLTGMPEAVRITLWADANPRKPVKPDALGPEAESAPGPALVFQTVARLNLAAASQTGFSSSGSSPAGGESGAQPTLPNGIVQ